MSATGEIEKFLLGREQLGMVFGLARTRRLLSALDDPQDKFPAVHVVGTNGKSSTTLMIAAALSAQELRVGAFTSPHLVSFRERIELGGEMIGEPEFERALNRVAAAIDADDAGAADDDRVTQFEACAAIALVAFAEAEVDVAVVEAGLGGRLDATNVLGDSRVQVLTSVGIDHTQYLGETLEAIAREKVAVARSGGLMVSGPLPPVVRAVVNAMTDERDVHWIELSGPSPKFSDLPGEFMRANASLALTAADGALERISPGVWFDSGRAADSIRFCAAGQAGSGRLQIANHEPYELRDRAHNPHAAAALATAAAELGDGRAVTLLVAMLADKPVDETLTQLLRMVSAPGTVVCTTTSNPRSLSAEELAEHVRELAPAGVEVEAEVSPIVALGRARKISGREGMLVVTGSSYLLGDLLRDPAGGAGATL
jgi:dihydrofolate synthase/folylpolyglutamate synthase